MMDDVERERVYEILAGDFGALHVRNFRGNDMIVVECGDSARRRIRKEVRERKPVGRLYETFLKV